MRVEIYDNKGGYSKNFLKNIVQTLQQWTAPVIKKLGTEYVAIISVDTISIFRVSAGKKCHIISEESMVTQIRSGCVSIGFVDIHSEDITGAIRTLIEEYWTIVQTEANGEYAVVFSPQQEISDL